ncbi:MAG: type II toxin-antitoxin system RelE/ParE family toxin [Planctomycetota bacterium]
MSYAVRISPAVRAQIEEQIDYYLGEGAPADRIIGWAVELEERFNGLTDHPRRFPVDMRRTQAIGREIRRFEQGKFSVFYRVDDDQKTVDVLDIRHGSRRPSVPEQGDQ